MKALHSFRQMSIDRRLLERRLFGTFIVTILCMAMIANMTRYDNSGEPPSFTMMRWASCFLQLQFTAILGLLLAKTVGQSLCSTVTFLTCIALAIVECFIASMELRMNGAFAVRVVGYVLICHLELVASTAYREWSLFGLFVSLAVEFVAWLILIPVHNPEPDHHKLVTSILYSLVSITFAASVWIFVRNIPPLTSRGSQNVGALGDSTTRRGFRYDDAVYSLSPGNNHMYDGLCNTVYDSVIWAMDSTMGGPAVIEYLSGEDPEIMDIRFRELADMKIHVVYIAIHVGVTFVAFLGGRNVLSDFSCDLMFCFVINSAIALWQMYKIFEATSTAQKVTFVKHHRHLFKAQKDNLKTLNTISAELKWATSAIRGVLIPTATSESNPIQRTMRALLWAGLAARMLEVGNEAALLTTTKTLRLLSLRHVIVTFGTCLNCQSISAVKDMHTSVSVSVHDGYDALGKGDVTARQRDKQSTVDEILKDSVLVVAKHDILFYGLLGLHSYIVMLADPHQEIKFQIEILRDHIRENVRVTITVCHWGEVPKWSTRSPPHAVSHGEHNITGDDSMFRGSDSGSLQSVAKREADAVHTTVESIRDSLGGSISSICNSRLCSTTMRFVLPAGKVHNLASVWRPRSVRAPWILIVDVSKVCRKLIKKNILRILPHALIEECMSARSAITSVARCGAEKFDYVFADYVLNSEKRYVCGGVQLCSKLRSFAKNATIIGMTGDSYGVALTDFLLNGADVAYVKPLTHAVLHEIFAVHSFLGPISVDRSN